MYSFLCGHVRDAQSQPGSVTSGTTTGNPNGLAERVKIDILPIYLQVRFTIQETIAEDVTEFLRNCCLDLSGIESGDSP